MRPSSRTDRGFTILEAMTSMVILVIGVLGLMHMVIYTAQSSGAAQRKTVATALARDLIDQIANWPLSDPRLTKNIGSDSRSVTCSNATSSPGLTTCTVSSNFLPLDSARPLAKTTNVDHTDADLGTSYQGQPLPDGYERVWNVYPLSFSHQNHTQGVTDVMVVVVVVRYWQNGSPQDVALTTTLVNYGEVVKGGIL